MRRFSCSGRWIPSISSLIFTVPSLPRLLLFIDPVMTVSADSSAVVFDNCGFSRVDSGTCVIEVQIGTRWLFPVPRRTVSSKILDVFIPHKELSILKRYKMYKNIPTRSESYKTEGLRLHAKQ